MSVQIDGRGLRRLIGWGMISQGVLFRGEHGFHFPINLPEKEYDMSHCRTDMSCGGEWQGSEFPAYGRS
jgi:hypothetical protein